VIPRAESLASGVGQLFAQVSRLGLPFVAYSASPSLVPLLLDPYRVAVAVGYSPRDHEEPLSFVRRADVFRSRCPSLPAPDRLGAADRSAHIS